MSKINEFVEVQICYRLPGGIKEEKDEEEEPLIISAHLNVVVK